MSHENLTNAITYVIVNIFEFFFSPFLVIKLTFTQTGKNQKKIFLQVFEKIEIAILLYDFFFVNILTEKNI